MNNNLLLRTSGLLRFQPGFSLDMKTCSESDSKSWVDVRHLSLNLAPGPQLLNGVRLLPVKTFAWLAY